MDIELSQKQKEILDAILEWQKRPSNQYLTLGGYAGTGKTTLLGYFNEHIHLTNNRIKVAFCTFTGKASTVLSRKLKDVNAIKSDDYIGTIHKLIYVPETDDDGEIICWKKLEKKNFKYDLIVVDEASMVSRDIWNDLLSYDKPILAVGDHGQLPPVGDTFNLMQNPMLRLEEIYRQEQDNPIIKLSEIARKYGEIPAREFSDTVKKYPRDYEDLQSEVGDLLSSYNDNTLVLVGYNSTRILLNKEIRGLLEFETPNPDIGDRVICLKNNSNERIYNGMIGQIQSIEEGDPLDGIKIYNARIAFEDEVNEYIGPIAAEQFNQKELLKIQSHVINFFDFGYAITVHKAQGSQADRVILFEERFPRMDDDTWRRWLYTAVTRAVSELYIIAR